MGILLGVRRATAVQKHWSDFGNSFNLASSCQLHLQRLGKNCGIDGAAFEDMHRKL